jgi:hypothetical protein
VNNVKCLHASYDPKCTAAQFVRLDAGSNRLSVVWRSRHLSLPSFTTFITLQLTYASDIVIVFSDHLFLLTQVYSHAAFLEKGENVSFHITTRIHREK